MPITYREQSLLVRTYKTKDGEGYLFQASHHHQQARAMVKVKAIPSVSSYHTGLATNKHLYAVVLLHIPPTAKNVQGDNILSVVLQQWIHTSDKPIHGPTGAGFGVFGDGLGGDGLGLVAYFPLERDLLSALHAKRPSQSKWKMWSILEMAKINIADLKVVSFPFYL